MLPFLIKCRYYWYRLILKDHPDFVPKPSDRLFLFLMFSIIGIGMLSMASVHTMTDMLFIRHLIRIILGLLILLLFANIPPVYFLRMAPYFYLFVLFTLFLVLIVGFMGKGAQRWLSFGVFNFEPSEFMKLALPLCLAWQLYRLPWPPDHHLLWGGVLLTLMPIALILKQPDLGTAVLIAMSAVSLFYLVGVHLKILITVFFLGVCSLPIIWHFMHSYQKNRLLYFFHPSKDPLGAGYHSVQSKIAVGSGGVLGKGFQGGTQVHFHFLPEHSTDFAFSLWAEEWGFLGALVLIILIFCLTVRALKIAENTPHPFSRLLASSLAISYFLNSFINIAMVTGILPVVGVPLPLISFGGTNLMVNTIFFGMILSIDKYRYLYR